MVVSLPEVDPPRLAKHSLWCIWVAEAVDGHSVVQDQRLCQCKHMTDKPGNFHLQGPLSHWLCSLRLDFGTLKLPGWLPAVQWACLLPPLVWPVPWRLGVHFLFFFFLFLSWWMLGICNCIYFFSQWEINSKLGWKAHFMSIYHMHRHKFILL